jgi:hypothetical protein
VTLREPAAGCGDFAARYPSAGHLLTRRLNEELITGMWDDLLRVAASVKGGHATAALVVGKLCSSKRQQNALASAIKEYGPLRRTVYAALMWNLGSCQAVPDVPSRGRSASVRRSGIMSPGSYARCAILWPA